MEKFRKAWDALKSCPIDIRDLPRARNGKKCRCTCVECKLPLIAYQGPIRAWHFRHRASSNCKGGPMTALHWMAQFLLMGTHSIKTKGGEVHYSNGTMEFTIPGSRYKADVAGDKQDGAKFLIEIFVTHKLIDEDDKVKFIREKKIHAIEIDLSHVNPNITNVELLKLLLNETSLQKSIYQPLIDLAIEVPANTIEDMRVKERTWINDLIDVVIVVASLIGLYKLLKYLKGSDRKFRR